MLPPTVVWTTPCGWPFSWLWNPRKPLCASAVEAEAVVDEIGVPPFSDVLRELSRKTASAPEV